MFEIINKQDAIRTQKKRKIFSSVASVAEKSCVKNHSRLYPLCVHHLPIDWSYSFTYGTLRLQKPLK